MYLNISCILKCCNNYQPSFGEYFGLTIEATDIRTCYAQGLNYPNLEIKKKSDNMFSKK